MKDFFGNIAVSFTIVLGKFDTMKFTFYQTVLPERIVSFLILKSASDFLNVHLSERLWRSLADALGTARARTATRPCHARARRSDDAHRGAQGV